MTTVRWERKRSVARSECVEFLAGTNVGKIILFAEPTVDMAGNACCKRSFDTAAIAANQDGESDFRMRLIGVGQKPADMRNLIGACSCFSSGHVIAARVEAAFACAVKDRRQHAFPQFGKQRSNVQFALDARNECTRFFSGYSILQIEKRATVSEGRGQGSQLEGRHLDPFAEAGHARDATFSRRSHRKSAGMLVLQIVAGKFAKTKQAPIT